MVFNVKVDSSYTILSNNKLLVKLDLHYDAKIIVLESPLTFSYNSSATQLFGGKNAIFNFDDGSSGFCDGDCFQSMLCYEDPSFGLAKFSSLPCDYSIEVGLHDEIIETVAISPNPSNGLFNLRLQAGHKNLQVFNASGHVLLDKQIAEEHTNLDLRDQPAGLYFAVLRNTTGDMRILKLIRE